MLLKAFFIATTLVQQLNGAPHGVTPDLEEGDKRKSEASIDSEIQNTLRKVIDIAPASSAKSHQKVSKPEAFYPYQSSISPRIGGIYFSKPLTGGNIQSFLGFNYMFDSPTTRHMEMGADLISGALGIFHAAYRWMYSPNSANRKFVKAGISLIIEPSNELSNFLIPENYQVRVAAGMEWLLLMPMSLRLDLEMAFALSGLQGTLVMGYSWAW